MIDLARAKLQCTPMGARLWCGGGGGDGGYAERQAQLKAEQDAAIQKVNAQFGKGEGAPIYSVVSNPGGYQVTNESESGAQQGNFVPPSETRTITGYDTATRDANAAARENLYKTISTDAEARLLDKLGQDRTKATRAANFQLARQGLAGGSAAIDQGSEILKAFQEGSLKARDSALAAGNNARSADEKTRVSLINNIRSGMAENDALSAAYAGMQNNANEARDQAMATDIGGFFNDLAILNNNVRYQQGMSSTLGRYGSSSPYGSASTGGFGGGITRG